MKCEIVLAAVDIQRDGYVARTLTGRWCCPLIRAGQAGNLIKGVRECL